MNSKTTPFPLCAALLAIIGGVVVLLGWAFDNDSLKGILPFCLPMKANAAICFVLLGSGIILSDYIHGSRTAFYIGQSCVLLAGLICVFALIKHLFHINQGIGELLFHTPVMQRLETATRIPERIKLEAIICILLLAIASIRSDKTYYWCMFSTSCGVIVFSLAMASLSVVLNPELGQFGWFGYDVMRVNAAVLLALLGAARIILNWQRNVSSWLLSRPITLAFIAWLFLLVLIGFHSSRTQFWLQNTHNEITANENSTTELNNLLVSVSKAQTVTRGYVITGSEQFLTAFQLAKTDSFMKLNVLKPIEQDYFNEIDAQVQTLFQWYEQVIDSRQRGLSSTNNMIFHGTELLDNLSQLLLHIKVQHEQHITQLKQAANEVTLVAYHLISIGTSLSVMFFLTAIFRFNFIESQRKLAEMELRIAATVFEAQEGMLITDANGTIIKVNHAFTLITGYGMTEIIGKNPRILQSGRHDCAFYTALWQSVSNTGTWQGELWNRRKNGEIYPQWHTITAVRANNDNEISHYVATFTDITNQKADEEKIKQLAFYDPLTGLPNRRKLLDRLHYAIAFNHRANSQFAVFMMDLDKFKAVNDKLGHAAGDELLKQVAERITGCLRDSDMVARLGGDEFVLVLENLKIPDDAEIIALKVITKLTVPFQLSAHNTVQIGASIGISIYPQHGNTLETLMDHADTALYQAKDNGRGCFAYFSEANSANV